MGQAFVRNMSWILAILVLAVGCRSANVYNPGGTLSAAPLEVRERQVERAARIQGWTTEMLAPGVMLATKRRGQHVATTTIRFDETGYTVRLRNSVAMRQSGGRIHKTYNVWVRGLDESIRREAAASYPAPVASPPAPAATAPAGVGGEAPAAAPASRTSELVAVAP